MGSDPIDDEVAMVVRQHIHWWSVNRRRTVNPDQAWQALHGFLPDRRKTWDDLALVLEDRYRSMHSLPMRRRSPTPKKT